jgi:predicted enzyme related to lactoylglutathione lyase
MPERSDFASGIPSWVDIGADIEPAKAFYGGLFGWVPRDAGPPEQTGGYGFFTKDGKLVAGYGPKTSPGPPAWSVYVATADAEATAARVKAEGGTIVVAPTDVMAAGRMAVFTDPTGAFFSVWQAGEHRGAQLTGEAGAMSWIELNSRDVTRALQFYPAVFGWEAETHEGPMTYTEFHLGGEAVGGMLTMPEQVPAEVPSHWLVYFGTTDVDGDVTRARDLGANPAVEGMDLPGGGRFAVLIDPQGAVFGLYRPGS